MLGLNNEGCNADKHDDVREQYHHLNSNYLGQGEDPSM